MKSEQIGVAVRRDEALLKPVQCLELRAAPARPCSSVLFSEKYARVWRARHGVLSLARSGTQDAPHQRRQRPILALSQARSKARAQLALNPDAQLGARSVRRAATSQRAYFRLEAV
jgi:hypothetical protein